MDKPVQPESPVTEDWMNDADALREFEAGLAELDQKLESVTKAVDRSEQLSEDDWAIRINTRD